MSGLLKSFLMEKKKLNATIVGNPTISNDFIISPSSSFGDRIEFPIENPNNKDFKIVGKFKVTQTYNLCRILSTSFAYDYNIRFYLQSNTINILIQTLYNGSLIWANNPYQIANNNINVDTWYWFKLGYSDETYYIDISSDKLNYIRIYSVVSNFKPYFSFDKEYIGSPYLFFDLKEYKYYIEDKLVYKLII